MASKRQLAKNQDRFALFYFTMSSIMHDRMCLDYYLYRCVGQKTESVSWVIPNIIIEKKTINIYKTSEEDSPH